MTAPSIVRGAALRSAAGILCVSLFAGPAAAQVFQGGQAGQPGLGAGVVPLSGRTAQGGTVTATQTPVPGATTSVDTINPVVQVQGGFAGSMRAKEGAGLTGPLSLPEAIRRGVEYNLGPLNLGESLAQARGQYAVARSALLPNVSADLTGIRQQVNLAALGVQFAS